MKKKVHLSGYSIFITAFITITSIAMTLYFAKRGETIMAVTVSTAIAVLYLSALIYMPLSIEANQQFLSIYRPLALKRIPLSQIKSVTACSPTMGVKRICGSGGFLGYWGWFSEHDTGKYFAYHGKSSDCFLITLYNGRKYMLGCKDAPAITTFISETIRHA